MATVTKEHIGELHEKLNLTISKGDYLPAFEKALKEYSKKANIPGFRKGQVPPGLIKKMYGSSVFTDEILRSIDRELIKYLEDAKLEIFAQPLPVEMDIRKLNMNNPEDYTFSFEVGMKPEFQLPDLSKAKFIRYKVTVTDEMVTNEVVRLQNRYGNMHDLDTVDSEENVLNVTFTETDENSNETEGGISKQNSLLVKYFSESFRKELIGKHINDYVVLQLKIAFDDKEREWVIEDLGLKENPDALEKHFKMVITKIGLLEKKVLNEEFFELVYPGQEIKSEADFRIKLKDEIQTHWDAQARNQLHDQIYHQLIDHSEIKFPESFLKKWMKTQGDSSKTQGEKTDEEVEKEFPVFLNQLKWTLITEKLMHDSQIQVTPEELRQFAKQQLLGYMGTNIMDDEQGWIKDYVEKMMKDRKYVEDAYTRIQTQKIFDWTEKKVNAEEKEISLDDFVKMQHHHNH